MSFFGILKFNRTVVKLNIKHITAKRKYKNHGVKFSYRDSNYSYTMISLIHDDSSVGLYCYFCFTFLNLHITNGNTSNRTLLINLVI